MTPEQAIEAIRSVLEELLQDTGTSDPKLWAMKAIAAISAILDEVPLAGNEGEDQD